MQPIKLSVRAAERDILAPASRIVEVLSSLHGQAVVASFAGRAVGHRFDEPAAPIYAVDRGLNPRECEHWQVYLPEDVEVAQHWIVSDWLAERLAAHGELVLLVCDDTYVWCRTGCGYPIADDLAFLDVPDDDELRSSTLAIDDPTEYDHAKITEHRRSDP